MFVSGVNTVRDADLAQERVATGHGLEQSVQTEIANQCLAGGIQCIFGAWVAVGEQ